ncbi:hypothetical protein TNIN_70451 [Trichonephila inaurata madagascariensis]|uniref:Uncharacterized protein n=1 Tax=Trichonephila inaurata madagascariensis TaxID=2747483 RepID=A0A8X7CEJ6_9ARAC|nr:hypothetical protein TNIN_70451 [Trichonephila inaurata madagascariensis]
MGNSATTVSLQDSTENGHGHSKKRVKGKVSNSVPNSPTSFKDAIFKKKLKISTRLWQRHRLNTNDTRGKERYPASADL